MANWTLLCQIQGPLSCFESRNLKKDLPRAFLHANQRLLKLLDLSGFLTLQPNAYLPHKMIFIKQKEWHASSFVYIHISVKADYFSWLLLEAISGAENAKLLHRDFKKGKISDFEIMPFPMSPEAFPTLETPLDFRIISASAFGDIVCKLASGFWPSREIIWPGKKVSWLISMGVFVRVVQIFNHSSTFSQNLRNRKQVQPITDLQMKKWSESLRRSLNDFKSHNPDKILKDFLNSF